MPLILSAVQSIDYQSALLGLAGTVVLAHALPYLWDSHRLRSYPGPFLAKFSDLWLGRVSKGGHRSEVVHEMHQKYGQSIFCFPA